MQQLIFTIVMLGISLLSVCASNNTSSARTWYVSMKGNDTIDCGDKTFPCKTIRYTTFTSKVGDKIAILSLTDTTTTFDICKNKKTSFIITKSLTFEGINGKPSVTCSKAIYGIVLHSSGDHHVDVKFINIDFSGMLYNSQEHEQKMCKPSSHGMLSVISSNVTLINCSFRDICTGILLSNGNEKISDIKIKSSIFLNVHYVLYSTNSTMLMLDMDSNYIEGSLRGDDEAYDNNRPDNLVEENSRKSDAPFYAISIIVKGPAVILINNCTFRKVNEAVSISQHKKWLKLKINESKFRENNGQSIILNFAPSVEVSKSVVNISNVEFIDNDGGYAATVHLIRTRAMLSLDEKPAPTIYITDSIFEDNTAQAFFGAIFADGVDLKVRRASFISNIAGDEDSALQAFGGAIFVEDKTRVQVSHSHFVNNTCSGFGGTVFSRGNFSATNCTFTGSNSKTLRPLLGDIIYATAGLHLTDTRWLPTRAVRSRSFLWHPGSPTLERWHIRIKGYFDVRCPTGHNITHHGVIREVHALTDRVSLSCHSCPRNEYSLQAGCLRLEQRRSKVISYRQDNASCFTCRYGGVCEHGIIRARSNYYGYAVGEPLRVRFISCPPGYCCQGDLCEEYNSCSQTRQGVICGRCKSGLTENLLNSECVKPENCVDSWFWMFYFPFGVLYIAFFMYLDKVNNFVKKQIIWWERKMTEVAEGSSLNTSRNASRRESSDKQETGIDETSKSSSAQSSSSSEQAVTEGRNSNKEITKKATADENAEKSSSSAKDSMTSNSGEGSQCSSINKNSHNNETEALNDSRNTSGQPNHGNESASDNAGHTDQRASSIVHIEQAPHNIEKDKRSHNKRKQNVTEHHSPLLKPNDPFSDFINIIFYFYQMLLVVRTRENVVLSYTIAVVKAFFSSIFSFTLESESSLSLCPFPGLTPVTKALFVRSFVGYIIMLLLLGNAGNDLYRRIKMRFHLTTSHSDDSLSFGVRLKASTIQILLLAYSTVTNMALTLVNCVPLNSQLVLYIDGTVKCFTLWQWLIFGFIFLWVIPFPITLVLSTYQLKRKMITYRKFALVWGFPLFYLLEVIALRVKAMHIRSSTRSRARSSESNTDASEDEDLYLICVDEPNEEKHSIQQIITKLEGSFKGPRHHGTGEYNSTPLGAENYPEPAFWQGVMIGRRLILIMLFTFVNSPVLRLYCALLACIVFLIHHLMYRPYLIDVVNHAETVSSAMLVVICSMNLFFAYSYVSNVPPEGADESISLVFMWVDAIILAFVPSIVVFSIALLFLGRLGVLIVKYCISMVKLLLCSRCFRKKPES